MTLVKSEINKRTIEAAQGELKNLCGPAIKRCSRTFERRLQRAAKGLSRVRADLEFPEGAVKIAADENIPEGVGAALLAPSIESWQEREFLAKINYLARMGLLDAPAKEFLTSYREKIRSSNDSIDVQLSKTGVPRAVWAFLRDENAFGLKVGGNVIVKEDLKRHHSDAWSASEPAYDSNHWTLLIGIVRQQPRGLRRER